MVFADLGKSVRCQGFVIFNQRWREPFVQFPGLGLVVLVVMSIATEGEGVNQRVHVSESGFALPETLAGIVQTCLFQ